MSERHMTSNRVQILQRSGVPLPAPASSAADAAAAMAIPAPLSADSAAQSAEADPLLAFTAAMEASGGLAACSRAVLSSGKWQCIEFGIYELMIATAGLPACFPPC